MFGKTEQINHFVEAFNRYPSIQTLWLNYLQQNHPEENLTIDKITPDLILKIGQDLSDDLYLEHQYTPANPYTVFQINH